MSFFDREEFMRFCNALRIDSKERSIIALGPNLTGSQRYTLDRLCEGFEQGVHEFVTLKSRQVGLSTLCTALDLYWINKYTGLNGAIITQDDKTRDQFRTTLQLYRDGLDESFQRDVLDDNRNQLVLKNGSKLQFRVAGRTVKKGGSNLGRSGALTLCHSTETAFYGDFKGIDSLRASFAQQNPVRFFHFESTANGTGGYEDMWNEAAASSSIRQIFVGWWTNDFYRCAKDSSLWLRYWGKRGHMSREEQLIARAVKRTYGVQLDGEQWAWYRYMAAEKITDELMMRQEFPHLPEYAFIDTGTAFFRGTDIKESIGNARAVTAQHFHIRTGRDFWNTEVSEAVGGVRTMLSIYAEPVPGAHYALGCDPAYSSSDEAANNVISVWRCWYNRIEQVAEFADKSISTHAVAWVFAYLAGYYGRTTTNLEINGPGQQVLAELQNLRRQASSRIDEAKGIREVLKFMKQYLYRKLDTFNAPNAVHTKTNHELKERMMNGMRDYLERGLLIVRSTDLVVEMKTVARQEGSAPSAKSGYNDDRVVAAALACMCWNDQMRQQLINDGVLWRPEKITTEPQPAEQDAVERLVSNYFDKIGIGPASQVPAPRKVAFRGKKRWREKVAEQRARGL